MEKTKNRRQFLKSAAVAAGGVLATRSRTIAALTSKPRRPNILFIIADDQRNDTIHAWGNPVISTPNIDSLARSGFSFRQCRTMGSHTTGAVCVPSRAMVHTGRYLFRVPDNIGPHQTLGQTLQQNGYATFGCGKWHNGPKSFAKSFNAGSHIFFGGMNWDQYKLHYQDFDPTGQYPSGRTKEIDQFSTHFYTDAAADFLKQQNGEQPFFCYLAFTSPHDPRTPPGSFARMYDPAKMPLPKNWMPQPPFDNGDMAERDEKLAPMPRTPEDTKQQLCDYYGMISSQDHAVGRAIANLKSSGQFENTLIVYTGDHGLCIGSHGLFGKQNVYEEAVGVPCIVSGPGIPHGESRALSYGADLFPTLCNLLQIPIPKSVDGQSLAPIIAGKKENVRDSAYNAFFHKSQTQESVREARWKLMRCHIHDQQITQLFDLQNDPDEIHDLSNNPAAQKQIPRLEAMLQKWQHTAGRSG
ncbi:MAG TPA: sulfatase-like hydrolase/transferase [Tepidisphaeraceae bacterium]|jgi:arylsulfatase A-like enzyme